MIIGITGRGASGKSTLANRIAELKPKFVHIDVDTIVETRVLNSQKLINDVNKHFTDKEYTINDVILSYFDKTEKNNILHSFFVREVAYQINEFIKENENENIVVEWFLLHEIFGLLSLDLKVLTIASKNERMVRAAQREKTDDITMFETVDNAFVEVNQNDIDIIINTEKNFNYDPIIEKMTTIEKVLTK